MTADDAQDAAVGPRQVPGRRAVDVLLIAHDTASVNAARWTVPAIWNCRNRRCIPRWRQVAWNVSVGRNMAGIHFSSDAMAGLQLGENVALSVLDDAKECFSELFRGFSLTKFDGTTVSV